ncbi:MAG TPA: electron transfer flavoprotein subunit beta/FixA family protein [Thermomicrobiaceae bacterium]|nr:electron transfer flavoprotein subunit beta/FixA family protein [Thermomicrobiaceae bacterium]
MRIVVPLKAVPDLVEEMELNPEHTDLDREFLKFVLNEWDDQALEEALLIKEADGAEVVVVGLSSDPDIDQSLFTALAKGADRAVRLDVGNPVTDSHSRAAVIADYLRQNPADLVVTGVQAPDDLDGQLAPMVAATLDLPHVAVVTSVRAAQEAVTVRQEFSGGRSAELEVSLPAVIGIQAARQSPRYAPISRVRQMMQAGGIEESSTAVDTAGTGTTVRRMYAPVSSAHAEMIEGSPSEVADRIVALLASRGLTK